MARFRRTRYLAVTCQELPFLDVAALLQGEARPARYEQILAASILTGEDVPLAPPALRVLLELPADRWIDEGALEPEAVATLRRLAEQGLVLSDEQGEPFESLRARDETLSATPWNLYACLYHFMTKWRDVDVRRHAPPGEPPALTEADVRLLVERHGAPPPHFHALDRAPAVVQLPLLEPEQGLFDVLARRKTTRTFDAAASLTLDDLSVVLRSVFGVHGFAAATADVVALRKTSPSGGGLHPTEAYPLVRAVDGLEPGLYHYLAADHSLELMSALGEGEAAALATDWTAGQEALASAQALFVLSSRFSRNFWKYRHHKRAYAVLLMDAAHLSQTLYLVSAQLGLGAFVTAAVNASNIEERLGIDGFHEGVIAVCGCGVPGAGRSALDPVFLPYVPRSTEI